MTYLIQIDYFGNASRRRYVDNAWNPTSTNLGTPHASDAKSWKTRRGAEAFVASRMSKVPARDVITIIEG